VLVKNVDPDVNLNVDLPRRNVVVVVLEIESLKDVERRNAVVVKLVIESLKNVEERDEVVERRVEK
tara:strand:+ start:491 stop:688 length:198 start_codon:yes stop_codon:yes gene_type:complete